MSPNDYWQEAFECALDETGLFSMVEAMTPEQRKEIGTALAGAHESYGMAFYSPPSSEPSEIKRLEDELRKERSKVVCPSCIGAGRLRYNAGPWAVDTGCDKCRGEGKILP